MATKTYREVFTFINAAAIWLEKNKDESKLRYAVKKILKACQTIGTLYQEKIEDIDIEHCSVDEKTQNILKDERGEMTFTKDSIRKRNEARRKLFETSVEVATHFATDPGNLGDAVRDSFLGFVISEDQPVIEDTP